MTDKFKEVINQIDENMIRQWVRDLIIVKTFIGLKFQEAVLKKIANNFNLEYRLSNPEEESKGINGYIDKFPISLKPVTYDSKNMLSEELKGYVIYYEKKKDGLNITIPDEFADLLSKINRKLE